MQPTPQLQSVLCYGHDTLLLLTRQLMLMQLGGTCDTVMNDREYAAQLSTKSPDIILLCQSLSGEECTHASDLAAEYAPKSLLVVMFTRTEKCVPCHSHVMLKATDGPKAFVKAMSELIARPLLPAGLKGSAC